MPHPTADWTAERIRALPDDGRRYEVVEGELLVTPAPAARHQRLVLAFAVHLRSLLAGRGIGEVGIAPADIELDPRTLVQPDVFAAPFIEGRRVRDWAELGGGLLLAIEVLSPSTARADRYIKRSRYQRAGIPEYWIADPDARLIERWTPADDRPQVTGEPVAWLPPGAAAALAVDLPAVFAEALD